MDTFDLNDGGNWCRYMERLEQYFIANGIQDDAKKVAVLLCVMGEKPYELVHNLLAPTKPASKRYVPRHKRDDRISTAKTFDNH